MAGSLTRRGLVKAAPAAIITMTSGLPAEAADDSELLALRPLWLATRAEFEDALNALSTAQGQMIERRPTLPDVNDYPGRWPAYCAERKRVLAVIEALEIETGLAAAEEAEARTSKADDEMVQRIVALPARTREGIAFKREVLADWDGCRREDLTESLLHDLLVMGGFDA